MGEIKNKFGGNFEVVRDNKSHITRIFADYAGNKIKVGSWQRAVGK